ncbi:YccT family protein [Pantoea sp. A4]|uniref:YccT family protein n=1 Tax=Pantoea sp. A4 TaxID=1225184 RepID=UPI0003673CE5|nr:DUF2057 family protein [Pantoea sp. A4]
MKLSMAVSGLLLLLVTTACPALTLHLDPQIDLLALDGRKISGSLLKGASSLELERGAHQFLFRVDLPVENTPLSRHQFHSQPMIVSFNAEVKSVTIRLPELNSRQQRILFDHSLNFTLVDEQGREIISKRDRLPAGAESDLEQAMLNYNRTHQVASVPQFATQNTAKLSPVADAEFAWVDDESFSPLGRWFQRFDQLTRQQISALMKILSTS